MKPAQLPDQLVKATPRLLAELGLEETGHINFTELRVDSDRSCFVDLQAKLTTDNASAIEVRRDKDGGFHVIVPPEIKYIPGQLKHGAQDQPVASITIKEKSGPV
jgi:hypothetical protein